MDQFGSTVLLNFASTGDAAFSDVEQFRASANWQTLAVLAIAGPQQRRQLDRHQCALRFAQSPLVQVDSDHESDWIVARVDGEHRLDPGDLTGPEPVASVQNPILTSPPIMRASLRVMARPRPVPPNFCAVAAS